MTLFDRRGLSFEILLVNDASPDGTWGVIEQLSADDDRVIGVDLLSNHGQPMATMCGLAIARGELVATMDDDLEHRPDQLERVDRPPRSNARTSMPSLRAGPSNEASDETSEVGCMRSPIEWRGEHRRLPTHCLPIDASTALRRGRRSRDSHHRSSGRSSSSCHHASRTSTSNTATPPRNVGIHRP